MLIVAPHPTAIPPPPLWSILSFQTPLVVNNVINCGQRWGHEGVWDVVIRAVEEEEVRTIVLGCQAPIRPGVDDGGWSSGVRLVGLCGRQRQAGEEGGVGAAP
jgi:hypothetical protein